MGMRMNPRMQLLGLPDENDTAGMGLDPSGPMDYAEIARRIREVQGPEQDALRQQIVAGLESQNRILDQPSQLDLSPLMALTDAWTGSHLAKTYRKPDSDLQKEAALAKLSDQVSKSGKQLSENEISLLKTAFNVESNRQILGLKDSARAGAAATKDDKDFEKTADEQAADLSKLTKDASGVRTILNKLNGQLSKAPRDSDGRVIPPGFGVTSDLTSAQGAQQFADKYLPDQILGKELTSKEAQAIKQNAQFLVAEVTKLYSGAAATDNERAALKAAAGQLKTNSPSQFIEGLETIRQMALDKLRTIEAPYGKGYPRYKKNGGLTHEDFQRYNFSKYNMTRQEKIESLGGE